MTAPREHRSSAGITSPWEIALFAPNPGGTGPQQLTYGERAAIDGVLSQVRPSLAIEIGTAEGGTLRRIASHSGETHSFDLVPAPAPLYELPHVIFHQGDSHVQLPRVLAELAAAGRRVEFVFVDGDHTADGVAADLRNLLASPALCETIILVHDTINDAVRRGVTDAVRDGLGRLAHVDLDFVPGRVARRGPYRLQAWGGIGLLMTTVADKRLEHTVRQQAWHDAAAVTGPGRAAMAQLEARGTVLADVDDDTIAKLVQDAFRREDRPGRLRNLLRAR